MAADGKTSTPGGKRKSLRRAQIELLDMAEGIFRSQILFALNKLQVFNRIGSAEKRLEDIADEIGARPDTLARLLNAGVALKLLESDDGLSYRVNPLWQPMLLESSGDGYLGNWLNMLENISTSVMDLDKATISGGPVADILASKNENDFRDFILAMHNYACLRGRELERFLDTSGCETFLDLGCGPGTYAFMLGARNPELRLFLLDMPKVLEIAQEVRLRYQLENEVNYLPIDVTAEDIPGRYDIVLVSNTLHMLGEAESRKLLKRLYDTVEPSGSLVIQFQYMDEDRMGGRWAAILDMMQLCVTQHGRNHTVSETRGWMEDAGFTNIEFCQMSLLNTNGYLRGYKPKSQ